MPYFMLNSMNAIEKNNGACVVLAGAGTGKTFTIVEKIKHLILNKVYRADRIVCITFSNEAVNNLVLRIDKVLKENEIKERPVIRTFHGFSADLLRKYGSRIGIKEDFRIIDPDQAKVILHRNLKINAINCHRYIGTIGTAKDLGIKLEEFQEYLNNELKKYDGIDIDRKIENLSFELHTIYLRENKESYFRKKQINAEVKKLVRISELKKFVSAWSAYEKLKIKGNYQDYSDLNNNAVLLAEKNPEIAGDFDYIVVDEFQDTNKVQLDFITKLCGLGNVTVVGDMNQSIYRFRGAYKENLNLFKKFFNVSEEDIFNLDKSYRSPNKVLRTAHKLILNNYGNPDECFFVENVHNREGEEIEVYQMKNAREEARKVVELINKEIENGIAMEEICVLFRAHQHGRIIQKALEQKGIPYFCVSKASLLKQKSVRTAVDYLIILEKLKKKEKGGAQEWWDLVYRLDFAQEDLKKIGKAIKDFIDKYRKKKDEIKETENDSVISVYLFNNLEKFELSESGKLAAKILIEKIKAMLPFSNEPISKLVQEVFKISGLLNEQKTREEKESMLNLNKFFEVAKIHEGLYDSELSNFLYYLGILENLGIEIDAASLEEKGIRLMTSHATKGLEFKVVIITNFAQGRFPIERYTGNSLIPTELMPEIKNEIKALNEDAKDEFILEYEKFNQLLEERRLAYVSFTRAKEKLILTFAKEYGNKKLYPSLFLDEIKFKDNSDIVYIIDQEEKYAEGEAEIKPAAQFCTALRSENFEEMLNNIVKNPERVEKKEHGKFSPSALLLFDECQKQFEYKYVFNMPDRKTISWEAIRLGSFVHYALERGVSSGLKKADEFLELAKEISMEEEWESIEFEQAEMLIKVFFERNKDKFNKNSKTEQYLSAVLDGMEFIGFADRIDFHADGVEIVDYKTGKSYIAPKDRNWQLGFYALAAMNKYGKVKKVTLDMLKQERPLEFEIDDFGNAIAVNSNMKFNIYEVEEELIRTAHSVLNAYKNGFKACPIEKNCEFCNEYVYGL